MLRNELKYQDLKKKVEHNLDKADKILPIIHITISKYPGNLLVH